MKLRVFTEKSKGVWKDTGLHGIEKDDIEAIQKNHKKIIELEDDKGVTHYQIIEMLPVRPPMKNEEDNIFFVFAQELKKIKLQKSKDK